MSRINNTGKKDMMLQGLMHDLARRQHPDLTAILHLTTVHHLALALTAILLAVPVNGPIVPTHSVSSKGGMLTRKAAVEVHMAVVHMMDLVREAVDHTKDQVREAVILLLQVTFQMV